MSDCARHTLPKRLTTTWICNLPPMVQRCTSLGSGQNELAEGVPSRVVGDTYGLALWDQRCWNARSCTSISGRELVAEALTPYVSGIIRSREPTFVTSREAGFLHVEEGATVNGLSANMCALR